MANELKSINRTRRSVLGDSLAEVTDPIGAIAFKGDAKKGLSQVKAMGEEAFNAAAPPAAAAAAPQTLIEPETMPSDVSGRQAARRSRRQQMARRGRASTILTQYDDALGGEA